MVATPGIDTVASGAVVVFLMQILKRWKRFPWLREEGTKWTNRIVAAVMALFTAVGIHWSYNAGVEGGTLTLTCISFSCLAAGLYAWVKSFAIQEAIYQSTANRDLNLKIQSPNPTGGKIENPT